MATAGATNGFGQSLRELVKFGEVTTSYNGGFFCSVGVQQNGTKIKFLPVHGYDTILKGGHSTIVNTKLNCITGMKEYENKSLEELRFEDHQENRKSGNFLSVSGCKAGMPLFGQASQESTVYGHSTGGGMKLSGEVSVSNTGSYLSGVSVQQNGTKINFVPVPGEDKIIVKTKLNCITAMKEYENKSIEELRFEDHQANRKLVSTIGGAILPTSQPQSPVLDYGKLGNQNESTNSRCDAETTSFSQASKQAKGFGQSMGEWMNFFWGVTASNARCYLSKAELFLGHICWYESYEESCAVALESSL